MQEEIIDLVDTTNNIIGQINKKDAHILGKWHRTVCFLLVDSKKKLIYFQDKSNRSKFESHDFFVKLNGGHLLTGESPEQGIRELKEELGITISPDNIFPIGIDQTSVDLSADYKIREFRYYFIVDVDNVLDKLKFQDKEVSSVIYFNPNHALELVLGEINEIAAYVFEEDKNFKINLTKSAFKNFTDDNLYLRIFLAVKKYFEGEKIKHIVI